MSVGRHTTMLRIILALVFNTDAVAIFALGQASLSERIVTVGIVQAEVLRVVKEGCRLALWPARK